MKTEFDKKHSLNRPEISSGESKGAQSTPAVDLEATPETDDAMRADTPDGMWVPLKFARKLERERDEALEANRRANGLIGAQAQENDKINGALQAKLTQITAKVAELERLLSFWKAQHEDLSSMYVVKVETIQKLESEAKQTREKALREAIAEIKPETDFPNCKCSACETLREAQLKILSLIKYTMTTPISEPKKEPIAAFREGRTLQGERQGEHYALQTISQRNLWLDAALIGAMLTALACAIIFGLGIWKLVELIRQQ